MFIRFKDFILRIMHILIIIYLLVFVPIFWGWYPLVVISGSMEPTLNVGGLLYYHEYKIEDFKEDDILVYQTPTNIISHRIVEVTDDGFITKGDANNTNDSKLINKNILGIGTQWCIPFLGYYADFIYHHKWILFVSVAILLIDLLNELYRNRQEKRRSVKNE